MLNLFTRTTPSIPVAVEILPSLRRFVQRYSAVDYPSTDWDAFFYQIIALASSLEPDTERLQASFWKLAHEMAFADLLWSRHDLARSISLDVFKGVMALLNEYHEYFKNHASLYQVQRGHMQYQYLTLSPVSLIVLYEGCDCNDDIDCL